MAEGTKLSPKEALRKSKTLQLIGLVMLICGLYGSLILTVTDVEGAGISSLFLMAGGAIVGLAGRFFVR
jgi:hypothetical protein